jgi:hypothetical protein
VEEKIGREGAGWGEGVGRATGGWCGEKEKVGREGEGWGVGESRERGEGDGVGWRRR